ncbi:MAG TPA: hypothetical protein VHA55_11985 [Pseudorhodoplanes sp.]|jgi:hypothetical protein|nr:hypothetical protein [Pseudorhodoplanes sp.]
MKSIFGIGVAVAIALGVVVAAGTALQLACGGGMPGLRAGPVPIRFERSLREEIEPALHRTQLQPAQAAPSQQPFARNFFCGIRGTDLALVGLALFLVIISMMQTTWLRRAVAAAERSSQAVASTMAATQRAYVVFREFQVHTTRLSAIEDIQNCTVQPIWENAGTTPIRNGRFHVNWRYFERAIPNDVDLSDFDEMGNRIVSQTDYLPLIMGPRGVAYAPVIVIDGATVRQVREMQGRVLIWGWAEYDDVFGGPRHRTEFCYQMTVTGSMSSSHIGFSQYRRFNGVDDECERKPADALLRV